MEWQHIRGGRCNRRVAEFDEASAPVSEEKHSSLIEKMSERVEDYSKDLELYYQLKKILEDENLIEVVDD